MANVSLHARSAAPARSIPVWTWLTTKNRGYYLAGYGLLAILGLWTIFPTYWQLVTSLRSDVDLYTPVVALIPKALTLDHYAKVFAPTSPLMTQLTNSMIVAVGATLVSIVLGSMAGYALTRLRFMGRAGLARVLVYAYLAPGTILFIPIYVMMSNLGLRQIRRRPTPCAPLA